MKYNFEIYYNVRPNKKFNMNDYLKVINTDKDISEKDKVIFDLAKKYNTTVNSHDFDTELDMENFDIAKLAKMAKNFNGSPEDIFKSNLSTLIIGRNMNVEIDESDVINFINDIPLGYTFIKVFKKVTKNEDISLNERANYKNIVNTNNKSINDFLNYINVKNKDDENVNINNIYSETLKYYSTKTNFSYIGNINIVNGIEIFKIIKSSNYDKNNIFNGYNCKSLKKEEIIDIVNKLNIEYDSKNKNKDLKIYNIQISNIDNINNDTFKNNKNYDDILKIFKKYHLILEKNKWIV